MKKSYLQCLSDSLKTHSLKEVERIHHLVAAQNFLAILDSDRGSDVIPRKTLHNLCYWQINVFDLY